MPAVPYPAKRSNRRERYRRWSRAGLALSAQSCGLSPNGISEAMAFVVPPHTRSLTVVAVANVKQLYGLASLQTSDGVEHVQLAIARSLEAVMDESYYVEKVGVMPGAFYQNVRLGT